MKNIEELRIEYKIFMQRHCDIFKALEENANEYSEDYKKSIFSMFSDDWCREFVLEHLEAYSDEIDPDNFDEDKLYEEYMDYMNYVEDIINRRLPLYDENMKWYKEFKQWKKDNKIFDRYTQRNFDDWDVKFEGTWYGWGSNDLIFYSMLKSIDETNEDEVSRIVENANKVINLIKEYDDEDSCYSEEYVDNLSYINTKIRYRDFDDYCMHVYVLDHLENEGMWEVYREPFKLFIDRVINWVDNDFLFAVSHYEE